MAQSLDVAEARFAESGQTRGEVPVVVAALARDSTAIEVRKSGLVLGQEPADAHAVSFPLEVGEMPDILDQGEGVFLRLPLQLAGRPLRGGPGKQGRGRFEREKECLQFASVHNSGSVSNYAFGGGKVSFGSGRESGKERRKTTIQRCLRLLSPVFRPRSQTGV